MSNPVSQKYRFQMVVLFSVALYVGWFFFESLESKFYTPEIADLMTWSGYGAPFSWDVLNFLAYGFLLAYGIVCVGLIYFKPWARECFVLVTVLGLMMSFVFGINILTEASSVYLQLMNMIDGFIIAIIYFSELRKEFQSTHNKRIQSNTAEPRR